MALSMESLVYCEGYWSTQLVLLMVWALAWYLLLPVLASNVIKPFICSRPWRDQWADLWEKSFKAALFLEFPTKEAGFEFACLFAAILTQHFIGGGLATPAAIGYTGRVATAMACHGGLCEAGWELQDIMVRVHQVFFQGQAGKDKNPPALIVLLAMHHMMGMSLVVPMNVYYNDYAYYHEFVFLLQLAAAGALFAQNYGFTLDVTTPSGLKHMKVSTGLACAVIVYSRLFRFWYVGFRIVAQYYADSRVFFMCQGGLVLSLMGLFNILIVSDAVSRFKKFAAMKHTDKEIEQAAIDAHRALHRHAPGTVMTTGRKEWAKVRGAMHMGVLRRPSTTVVPNANR